MYSSKKFVNVLKNVPYRKYSNVATSNKINLIGIIIPVPTPFHENEHQSVDFDKLKKNIDKWETIPITGYCIGSTNGEWPFLSNDEKLQILETIKSSVNSSKLVIAGTTCESTNQSLDLSLAAIDRGADAILLMTPHYFRPQMTQNVIVEHFTKIADSISVPLIVYNNPFATGIDLSLSTIQILADHPNICGIKDADVFKLGAIVERTKDKGFGVLAGSAGYLLPSLLMGCSGGMNGLAAVLGGPLCEMFSLARANQWDKAVEIQKKLLMPDFLLLRELGPSGLKAAMDMLGYFGGSCRKPLLPVDSEIRNRIRQTLQASGYL
ncbi:4-hydroxy-2-oxoglutarate aldolase, mitochondrial-like [Planococcus citri]|uniref:4-hydroxy-2-oxoglutarate aldolase, mitochondrial-like n=1 Tax=Planococcus citri TaxID=170843 RepID=UPI0031F986FD